MAIGTAAAIGLGVTAVSTGFSFAQSSAQKKEQRKAENEAEKYLAEARKKLDVNFYEQLGIQKEPYELEREALLSAGAQAIAAGQESERGAAATAGRVYMAQQAGQRQIAGAMGQEMAGLEKAVAAEDSRLAGAQANLDIREATGAQKAAAIAEARSAQGLSQGMQGVASLGQQAAALFPDYKTSESMKELGKMQKIAIGDNKLSQANFQNKIASFGNVGGVDFSKVGKMNTADFQIFMNNVNPDVLKQVTQQFSSTPQSTNPTNFSVPNMQLSPSLYGFDVPSIGGQ
jgi:hypothetical protein